MTKQEALDKLVKDLEFRGRSVSTIRNYQTKVRLFLDYHDKPIDDLGEDEMIDYLHHLLTVKKMTQAGVNTYNSALRFFFGVTLDKVMNYKKLPRLKQNRSLPQLYTKEEVRDIIESTHNLRHKAWFMLAYGSGLRLSEILNLKITDIESAQMRIFVRKGKGGRDRYALLPVATLDVLRDYWRQYRPKEWLFESPRTGKVFTRRAVSDAFDTALERSGVTKDGSIHRLRHCFATHLLDEGCSLYTIKKLLGHVRIDTTAWYAQLSDSQAFKVMSPLDSLPKKRGRKPKKDNSQKDKL